VPIEVAGARGDTARAAEAATRYLRCAQRRGGAASSRLSVIRLRVCADGPLRRRREAFALMRARCGAVLLIFFAVQMYALKMPTIAYVTMCMRRAVSVPIITHASAARRAEMAQRSDAPSAAPAAVFFTYAGGLFCHTLRCFD